MKQDNAAAPQYARRYLAYCNEHGNTPEAQLAADEEAWAGGTMIGYTLWHKERLSEFAKSSRPGCFYCGELTDYGHVVFNDWLDQRVRVTT